MAKAAVRKAKRTVTRKEKEIAHMGPQPEEPTSPIHRYLVDGRQKYLISYDRKKSKTK